MDYKVGASIYNKPWLIEPSSAISLLECWEKIITQNVQWKDFSAEEKEGVQKLALLLRSESVIFAPASSSEARGFDGFAGADTAIIPVQGPLMKSDFCGDFGTASLARFVQLAEDTPSVKTIILLIDSPGGTIDGTEAFSNVIRASHKKTIAFVDGLAGSAAYWIASSCDEIFAHGETALVGSIGSMMVLRDSSKYDESRGIVLREYYATASKDKNKLFRDALTGDGKALIQELLDPMNDVFLQAVREGRSGKIDLEKENVFTGKVYTGKAAVQAGLVDRIATLQEAIEYGRSLSKSTLNLNFNTMAFTRTLKAAKADSFAVEDGGFLVTEDQLNNIEASLAATEGVAEKATSDLAQANVKLGALQEKNASLNARIAELEEKITALESSAPELKQTTKSSTDTPPITAAADDDFRTEVDEEVARLKAAIGQ